MQAKDYKTKTCDFFEHENKVRIILVEVRKMLLIQPDMFRVNISIFLLNLTQSLITKSITKPKTPMKRLVFSTLKTKSPTMMPLLMKSLKVKSLETNFFARKVSDYKVAHNPSIKSGSKFRTTWEEQQTIK